MNTAGRLRAISINLSANSPVRYVLDDGTVLDIVETQVVPDVIVSGEEAKRVGPDTLVVCLRPRAKPEQVNGTHDPAVPGKVLKLKSGPGY